MLNRGKHRGERLAWGAAAFRRSDITGQLTVSSRVGWTADRAAKTVGKIGAFLPEAFKLAVADDTGQRIRVYRLTARGRRRLTDEHSRWRRMSEAMAAVLAPPLEEHKS